MKRCYFDHNATTPVSPEVLAGYLPALESAYGNASSIHQDGQQARKLLEESRSRIAALLGVQSKEIVLLSGGTEADNLALFGLAREGDHVITTAVEHPAVLNAAAQLDATVVPVSGEGLVDPDDVRRALRPNTRLISVMHVNNELGAVQPLEELARIANEAGVLFHSDGVQACGRLPGIDLKATGVDLYSISGHKMYAPKGIGALYVRDGVALRPQLFGGRHERGRRAGTENVPGAVALGVAAQWAAANAAAESVRLAALRDRLEQGIVARVPRSQVNGGRARRAPNTTNIRFAGIEGESLVIALDLQGFSVSSGAACSSGAVEPSHVLTAIGLSREDAKASLRFSLGRSNDEDQVDRLVEAVAVSVDRLRKLSPVWAAAERS